MLRISSYITDDQIRRICIDNQFFTHGNNKEYQELFDMNFDGASILQLVYKITKHSEQDSNVVLKAIRVEFEG